jgi:hypothetical protein
MLEELYSPKHLAARGALLSFERALTRRGFGDESRRAKIRDAGNFDPRALTAFLHPRGVLAILRSVEPLADWAPSGFIERSWRDFEERELGYFLELSSKREMILLNRAPDGQWAHEQSARLFRPSVGDALERRSRALARKFGSLDWASPGPQTT